MVGGLSWSYVGPLGAMLAHLGLGAMLAHLGAILAHLGGYVGPSWGYVGPSRGYPGPSWGLCWPILRPIVGPSWPILNHKIRKMGKNAKEHKTP